MRWDEILIPPAVACLVAAETPNRPLDAPYADLRRQMVIDLGHNVFILHNELETDHIPGSMNALVGPGAANQ